MDFEEAVALAGGGVTAHDLEQRLTPAGVFALTDAWELMGAAMSTAVEQESLGPLGWVYCVITRSTSVQCRTRRLDDGNVVILIPLGILARTRVLARRLLWHLADEETPTIRYLASTLDVRTFPWELAPGLIPVFGEDATAQDDAYWEALAAFDARTAPDEAQDTIANDVMCYSFVNLGLHELVHITARHDQLLKLARAQDPRIPPHFDLTTLRRGMEVCADSVAAHNFVSLHMRHEMMAGFVTEHPDVFFGRSSFAMAMLFGLYDTHRKTVYEYDDGIYPHPIIRYELFYEEILQAVHNSQPPLAERAQQYSKDGWRDCMDAFDRLEWDCLRGEYGSPRFWVKGGTGRYLPVTTLKYGAASVLQSRLLADQSLAAETHRLAIEIFRPEPE